MAIAVIAGIGIYAVTSDDDPLPLNVDFVLGGGDNAVGKGEQLEIQGQFGGLAVTPDNVTYLFAEENDTMVMWRKKPSGAAERIQVSGLDSVEATQTAVAPDGSIYLAAEDLWKVSPAGKATKVIERRACGKANPLAATSISDFCGVTVTGVTVDKDGTVYVGDQLIQTPPYGSYVHRLDGKSIELVAGRPAKDGESVKHSNPAVRNGVDPRAGTKAKDVVVPDVTRSGALAAAKDGVYWNTGPGIVRINRDGTLNPFVAGRSPGKISDPEGPFGTVGRALDAQVQSGTGGQPGDDLAVIPSRDEVYYSDEGEDHAPVLEGEFRWQGVESDSQKKLLNESGRGDLVRRVVDGELAPVIAGVQAIATSKDSLYVAVTTDGGDKSSPENWDTAVLRVHLPKKN
ncbi:hypothetical protein [Streptomyces sp. MZ04]|uniref:hypothetical protein n=1 Tax=Streptomyces sp. MZ04 TaxID=2559236 RepID=UPI00107E7772|nr:hypothetical protein [Streptomyces sp. MZ04]TGB08407.1 hypothetical protein E2651_19245 [Streptomyces sp. MZ04]